MTFGALIGADLRKPKLTLLHTGPYAGAPQLQSWLSKKQGMAQSKVNAFKAHPVIQLGIGYRL